MLYAHTLYICLSCSIIVSNVTTLGVRGEDANPLAAELGVMETQQLVEWTLDDVFLTSICRA